MLANVIDPTLAPLTETQGLAGDGWIIYWAVLTLLVVGLILSTVVARNRGRDED